MLYDKRWDAKVETKADPFTLESLIAWLEKRSPSRTYCYTDRGHCLAAQYNAAHGKQYVLPRVLMGGGPNGKYGFRNDLEWIAVSEPHTFGAALDRARAELVKRG